jgi:hypothetical protein
MTPTSPPEELWDDPDLQRDPRVRALRRLVQSKTFSKSPRLTRFLLYVSGKALEGRPEEVTEQQVGIQVFGKKPGYNPGDDNSVRAAARQLRQRLALYYQEEASSETLRISLPRGGYLPQFEEVSDTPLGMEPSTVPERSGGWVKPALAAAAVAMVLVWIGRATLQPSRESRFWSSLFQPGGLTLLVPCDSGLVMLQNATNRNVKLAEYGAQGSVPEMSSLPPGDSMVVHNFGRRKYTTVADLKLTVRLLGRKEVQAGHIEVRFGRDIRVEDLRQHNAILVGGPQGNPWLELFNKDANFRIETDDRGPGQTYIQTVLNRKPLPGEQPRYVVTHEVMRQTMYDVFGIVSYQPNLAATGHVLGISGTSMTGLEAAAEFLFDAAKFGPILAAAERPNGTFRPFELLLTAQNISNNSVDVRLVARRIGGQ